MGYGHDAPTPAQLDEMKGLIDEAMRDGAFGLSCMVMFPPDGLANLEQLIELSKGAAAHGGIYSSHIRNEGTGVFECRVRAADPDGKEITMLHYVYVGHILRFATKSHLEI